jgi:hypothetical protein
MHSCEDTYILYYKLQNTPLHMFRQIMVIIRAFKSKMQKVVLKTTLTSGWLLRIPRQLAQEPGKVVSRRHLPTLPQEISLVIISVRG